MADETTIVEFDDAWQRSYSRGVPRNSSVLSYTKAIPHDSWFRLGSNKRFNSAIESGFMSDLTVKLRDGKLRCHSILLGFASPKLAAMIQNSPHEILLSGVTTNTFKTLMRIIYSEEAEGIKTDVEKIQAVSKIAHELKIYTAVTYCTKLLRALLNAKNVCSILDLAWHLDQLELIEACTKVIREMTDEVLNTDDFLKCDFATLEHILKQEIVHNVTELGLFQAAVRWAKRHDNPRKALGSNLNLIRFRTFTTKDFAAYVQPTNVFTDKEEQGLVWYLLAEGKGEMPTGLNNEKGKRHTTWSVDHICASTEQIELNWSNMKHVTKEKILASPQLRISVNEDVFLIGIKYMPNREGIFFGTKYMEDVEVTLKDGNGTLIAVANLNSEVEDYTYYNMTFPHPVELCADVIYQLKFSSNVPGVKQGTRLRRKEILNTKSSVKIAVHDVVESPISHFLIAPKVQTFSDERSCTIS